MPDTSDGGNNPVVLPWKDVIDIFQPRRPTIRGLHRQLRIKYRDGEHDPK